MQLQGTFRILQRISVPRSGTVCGCPIQGTGSISVQLLMRQKYSKEGRKFSLIDCVGYSVAESLTIPFLTGDREFEDLPGVEYVK